jgi:hypothetical protein
VVSDEPVDEVMRLEFELKLVEALGDLSDVVGVDGLADSFARAVMLLDYIERRERIATDFGFEGSALLADGIAEDR